MATSGPGFDVPGEWFIGSLNTTSLVLGHMRAIAIDNTTSPPTVRVNGTVLTPGAAGLVWQYFTDTTDTSLAPNPAFTGVPTQADLLFAYPIAGASTEGAGTRFMFDGSKAAIRGGQVTGTDWNNASRGLQSVAWGLDNTASGANSTVAGGQTGTASGSNATVGGGVGGLASSGNTTVAGGNTNTASAAGASCGGGVLNVAAATQSVVAGGFSNVTTAGATNSTIGGGTLNTVNAGGVNATISGGNNNLVSGASSTICGGINCTALGAQAVVLAGSGNSANGAHSSAGGTNANDNSVAGTWVWSDQLGLNLASVGAPAPVPNGVWWGCGNAATGAQPAFTIYTSATRTGAAPGVCLFGGASAWAAISDRNAKENLRLLDDAKTLEALNDLPIYEYNYKGRPAGDKWRGPMAQDWHHLFPSDKSPIHIDTMDLDGITLSAVRGLAALARSQGEELAAVKGRLAALESAEVLP